MTFQVELKNDATAKLGSAKNIKQFADGKSIVHRLNPLVIQVMKGWNLRDMNSAATKAHVNYLAGLISANGYADEHPLKIRMLDGKPTLVGGHSRLAAVKLCLLRGVEIATVPVVMVPAGMSDQELIADMAGTDNAALPLTVLEQADGVKRLLAFGWTHEQIAARMAVETPRIYQLIDVLNLPDDVKADIRSGVISASMAVKIVKDAGDAEKGKAAVKSAVSNAKADAAKKGKPGKAKVRSKHVAPAPAKVAPKSAPNAGRDKTAVTMMEKAISDRVESIRLKFQAMGKDGVPTTRVNAHNNGNVTVTFTQAGFQAFKAAIGL